MDSEKRRTYLRFLYAVSLCGFFLLCGAVYSAWWNQVPERIRIHSNAVQSLEFYVPASGKIYPVRRQGDDLQEDGVQNVSEMLPVMAEESAVFLDRPVTFVTGDDLEQYVMKLRLFGILPFKEVDIQVVEEEVIIPAGFPVGIYVRTRGVLVLGTGEFTGIDGQNQAPSEGILRSGDYILEADHEAVTGKQAFMDTVAESGGEPMILGIQRGDEVFEVRVEPKQTQSGEYKIGVWIRENAQGVGTLTYLQPGGSFGALGHGINDIDTSTLMNVESGSLYETEIVGIRKGENGAPGELTGIIDYSPEHKIGSIERNTEKGIFGTGNETLMQEARELPVAVGLKQEVHLGEAEIICSVTGETEHYQVQIEEVHPEREDVNRGMILRVTDERLLSLTGGIVQGMSGSPVLQDGRLIGAVTHVFVNDPTRGYGIFIETMLE